MGYKRPSRFGTRLMGNMFKSHVSNKRVMNKWNSAANADRSTRRRTANTGFLTNQYDVKNQYRRKSMPRRKRKRYVKFVKRIRSVLYKDLAPQYQMFRSFITGNLANGTQGVFSAGIYGENGVPATSNDMGISDLFQLDTETGVTTLLNSWDLRSAVLDIEITNLPTALFTGTQTVDCYEIICRKAVTTQGAAAIVGPADCFNKGFALQNLLGANTALGSTTPGVTPFQCKLFTSHFKILKKTRVLLSPGQATHFMYRDTKKRQYIYENASRPVCAPGWYHGFLFIIQGVCDIGNFATATSYSCTAQRYYTYAVNSQNEVQAGYANI